MKALKQDLLPAMSRLERKATSSGGLPGRSPADNPTERRLDTKNQPLQGPPGNRQRREKSLRLPGANPILTLRLRQVRGSSGILFPLYDIKTGDHQPHPDNRVDPDRLMHENIRNQKAEYRTKKKPAY